MTLEDSIAKVFSGRHLAVADLLLSSSVRPYLHGVSALETFNLVDGSLPEEDVCHSIGKSNAIVL